jgi:hypothetical protein
VRESGEGRERAKGDRNDYSIARMKMVKIHVRSW